MTLVNMQLNNTIINKVTTLKDHSVKIELVTRELSPEQLAEIFFNVNKEILKIEIPDDSEDSKSPSQRLRSVLYIWWEQSGKEKYNTFPLFYSHKMEQFIDQIKEKLTPNN